MTLGNVTKVMGKAWRLSLSPRSTPHPPGLKCGRMGAVVTGVICGHVRGRSRGGRTTGRLGVEAAPQHQDGEEHLLTSLGA